MTEARAAMHSPGIPRRAGGATAPVIVVGLDGSPTSWDAFCWAAGETLRTDGSLIAVYVTPLVESVVAVGAYFDYAAAGQAGREAAGQLQGEAAQRAGDLGVPLSFVWELGDAAHCLTSVARSAGADLVVVGRSAKVLHRLAGSLGRRLVSRHDAPVVVVVP
jgi:nucleotide-binding universal stress UspA family protein